MERKKSNMLLPSTLLGCRTLDCGGCFHFLFVEFFHLKNVLILHWNAVQVYRECNLNSHSGKYDGSVSHDDDDDDDDDVQRQHPSTPYAPPQQP
jgi:hypothetical protein